MTKLRTIFMGSDPIVLPLLERLVSAHSDTVQLVGIFTQPDRPHGRGMKLCANPVKEWATQHGIPVHQPEKPSDDDLAWIKGLGCDLMLVMAYGHILKDAFLEAPRLPPLNFHASLLPELRGASPIESAIATGRKESGVTLMRIVKKMDSGDILDVEKVQIGPDENRAQLTSKLAQACVPLLDRAIPMLVAGQLPFKPQDEARVSFCRILTKDDSNMDFCASAQMLHDRCHALHLWPGSAFDLGDQRIKVGETAVISDASDTPAGTVVGNTGALDVATGSGILRITRLQRPGGKMLTASEFLRGLPIAIGTMLASRPMLALERDSAKAK